MRDAGRSRPAALCHAAERRPAHSPPSGRSSARRHSGGRARGPALGSEGAGYAGAARSSRAAGRAVPLPARGKGRGRPRTPQRTATPARPRLRAPGTGAQSSPRTRPPCPHRGRQPPRESAAPPPSLHLPPRAPQPGAAPSTAAQPRPAALTFRRRPGNGVERRSPPPFRHWLQRRSAARGMAAAHVSRGAGIRVAPPRFRPRALLGAVVRCGAPGCPHKVSACHANTALSVSDSVQTKQYLLYAAGVSALGLGFASLPCYGSTQPYLRPSALLQLFWASFCPQATVRFCDLVVYTETRNLAFIHVILECGIYSIKRAFLLNESAT